MATETKVTFDGVKIKEAQYKTFEYTNTLINKSLPTGFCVQQGEEVQKTTYGTELDGIGQIDLLTMHLRTTLMNEQQYDHNYCLTDFKDKYYLLSDSVNWTATPLDSFDNLTQGVLSIISQLGYVNDEWKIHSDGVPKSIEFIITPKDVPPELLEESKYSLYFIPMDNYSYKLDSI